MLSVDLSNNEEALTNDSIKTIEKAIRRFSADN